MFRLSATVLHESRHILARVSQRRVIRSYAKTRPLNDATIGDGDPAINPLRLLLLGSPGSGKGTQSARIQHDFSINAVTSGDLLRRNIAAGSEIGSMASAKMAKGELVSDDVMISLITAELQKLNHKNWLLDGFPRTLQQALALDASLDHSGQPLNLVINLVVPEEDILQRIIDRWVHIPSGRIYNLSYNPPRVPGRDDVTGEPLSKRDDDNPDIFRHRLENHRRATEPLLEYYDDKALLLEMRGRTSDEIYPQVQRALWDGFGLEARPAPDVEVVWEETRAAGSMA